MKFVLSTIILLFVSYTFILGQEKRYKCQATINNQTFEINQVEYVVLSEPYSNSLEQKFKIQFILYPKSENSFFQKIASQNQLFDCHVSIIDNYNKESNRELNFKNAKIENYYPSFYTNSNDAFIPITFSANSVIIDGLKLP